MDFGRVLILYNNPAKYRGRVLASDLGVVHEVAAVEKALKGLGLEFESIGLSSLAHLLQVLPKHKGAFAINLVEGFPTNPHDMVYVPTMCDAHDIHVTGCDTRCMSLAQDKWVTKAVLREAGIHTPAGIAVKPGDSADLSRILPGKYIVKPASTDASEGIDSRSVVRVPGPAVCRAIARVHKRFCQTAIVEQMISGRELNVSLLETHGKAKVVAVAEIDFSAFPPGRARIVDYRAKWAPDSFQFINTPRILPATITAHQRARIEGVALKAWHVLGCRDYARIDSRLDETGEPILIEVNPNPDISPGDGFAAGIEYAGLSYEAFIQIILTNAYRRRNCHNSIRKRPRQKPASVGTKIRHASALDRPAVLALIDQPKFFRQDELAVAAEVFDDSIPGAPPGEYHSRVLLEAGKVRGWICFGPTPCTIGTFDIYWIVVAAGYQGRGYGRKLIAHAEREMQAMGARISVIETSSRGDYLPTRRFYDSAGYTVASQIPNFYSDGDDRVIYTKRIKPR
ncbi:MAG: GNAT family N-acetyltransferase [bacterium]